MPLAQVDGICKRLVQTTQSEKEKDRLVGCILDRDSARGSGVDSVTADRYIAGATCLAEPALGSFMHKAFETNGDIDVDALMASIRDKVKKRQEQLLEQPSQSPPIVKALDFAALVEETHNGELFVDAIDWVPNKRLGLLGPLEHAIKRFFKWLVHWNTLPQATFNRATINSVQLITEHLQDLESNLQNLQSSLQNVQSSLQNVQSSLQDTQHRAGDTQNGLEKSLAEMKQLGQRLHKLSEAYLEVYSKTEETSNKLSELERTLDREVKLIQEASARKTDQQTADLSAKIDRVAEHTRSQISGDFEVRFVGFRRELRKLHAENLQLVEETTERIKEFAQRTELHEARSTELEVKMTDELRRFLTEATLLAELGTKSGRETAPGRTS